MVETKRSMRTQGRLSEGRNTVKHVRNREKERQQKRKRQQERMKKETGS
jgi:hypothetical protein